ncbi:MAG TPA: glycosyl hydrolase family 18 protein [Candidatus Acidoferrales bacterium]|nr:glycosyl hydrolase family 18 protein [Candidatus Acidoferrales bacterium]
MKQRFIAAVFIGILCIGLWLYLSLSYPATSPFTSAGYFAQHLIKPHTNLNQRTLGFLPYWNLDYIQFLKPEDLSEINYFSLTAGSDGHILQVVNNQNDPGWNGWIKQATKNFLTKSQIMGARVTVTIAAQDNQTINAILNSNTAQQNLIADILEQVKKRNLNGVNIDFEYSGAADNSLRQEFTYFSKKLASQLKQQDPNATVSLSIMPLSARQPDLFDFKQLVPIYDQFIGMSYDYYGESSDIAGPIAPMNGFKQGKYFFDVTTTYADYEKVIPKNKLIMGVPYYGWEWAVVAGKTINSQTFPASDPDSYAAVISYARARSDSDLTPKQCQWDAVAEESWCWFTDKTTKTDHQAWIADNRMIQTRFDFAKKQDFAGIAIWTLGLDKQYPDLWDQLVTTFGK